jgi:hypothetical protein
VAARVQALAEPGTVLATPSLQRQVAGLFVAEDREAHALKASEMPEIAKAQALLGELSRLACDQEAWPLPLPAGPRL